MKRYIMVLLLVGIGISQSLMAQDLILTRSAEFTADTTISAATVDTIMGLLQRSMNEYAEAATLVDAEERWVNQASTRRFNALFSPTALVMKDYAKDIPITLIPFKDYALDAYNLMRSKGVEMEIEKIELQSIETDGLGFYTPKVLVKKKIYTIVDKNEAVTTSFEGRTVEQLFTFDVLANDLSRATIAEIGYARKIAAPEDYNQVISFSAGVGSSALSFDLADAYGINYGDSKLAVAGGLNYSFGAEFLTDQLTTPAKSPNRKLAASLGLRYASYEIRSTVSNFKIVDSDQFEQIAQKGDSINKYNRILLPVDAGEGLRLNILEIPLGLSYNFIKQPQLLFNIHLRAIPSIAIRNQGTVDGQGFYDGIFIVERGVPKLPRGTSSELRLERPGAVNPKDKMEGAFDAFQTGTQDINESTRVDDLKLGFGLQLSPTIYYSFTDDNPAWGLLVGIDLSYHFGYWLNHDPISTNFEDAALKYNTDYSNSLANIYLQNLSGLSYGIRVGVFNRLIKPSKY